MSKKKPSFERRNNLNCRRSSRIKKLIQQRRLTNKDRCWEDDFQPVKKKEVRNA